MNVRHTFALLENQNTELRTNRVDDTCLSAYLPFLISKGSADFFLVVLSVGHCCIVLPSLLLKVLIVAGVHVQFID